QTRSAELRHRLPTSLCRMQTQSMRERRPRVPRSRWISRTRITVAGAFHVAILKDVSGVSALMIRGPRLRLEDVLKQEENRSFRHQARSLRQTEKESVMEA